MGMAFLSKGENGQDLLPADESRSSTPTSEASCQRTRGPTIPCSWEAGPVPTSVFNNSANSLESSPSWTRKRVKATPWLLKDLRKTCATYYDEHLPESSIEILGHSVAGVTYRHYAHRAPLAFKAIMTIPQPSAFAALLKGYDGECPCCRTRFADAS